MAEERNQKVEAKIKTLNRAYKRFVSDLNKMEYYDINERKLKTFEFANRPPGAEPPGMAARVTEQTGETCSSEAMSRCVTEIADSSELDVDQEEIVKTFINIVQPDKRARHLHDFNHKSVFVRSWKKGLEKEKVENQFYFLNLGVLVQRQTVHKPSFEGPLMTQDQLIEHRTRMIAVWDLGEKDGDHLGFHAVYVKDWEEKRGDFVFNCINSWGDSNRPEPKIKDTEIRDLFYISLYPVRCLVITSSGSDTDHMTSFGVYIETVDATG